jgi:hypothetical protein
MRGSILSTAVVAALTGLLASACSGDEGGGNATPAATQAGTREPQLTATFTIPATNTPQPSGEAMKVFWLLDAESRDVVTLLEEYEEASYEAGFDSSAERIFVWSTPRDIEIEFDLAGNELSRTGAPERLDSCERLEADVIDGLTHASLRCLAPSGLAPYPSPGEPVQYHVPSGLAPDGRWYVYEVQTGLPTQTPGSGPSYALWALNLETGERWQLHESLRFCGGCDGDEETGWSPGGRYYVHVERGPDRHVLLIDFTERTVIDITWRNGLGFTGTIWSPVADLLLRTAGPNALAIADLAAGTEHIVPGVEWGAEFDTTGRYVIARSAGGNLTAIDVATGQVAREFAGERENSDSSPVVLTPDGLIAVTGRVDRCEGLLVQREATELGCVEGAESSSISPDGSKVAMTRVTAESEPLRRTSQLKEYEIVLFDVASGDEAVVATGAWSAYEPRLTWNEASTHVLIEWPAHRGL